MSNNAHFFDIDCLVRVENRAWVVDKKNPNVPLLKLSKSDLHLIENGIYRNQNNKIEFNGKTFWLPTNLYNKIKVKAKVNKTDLSSLVISLQEFYNAPVIDQLEFEFNLDTILTLKNTQPNIYIICSKQTKKNYSTIVEKLKEELINHGLKIKTFYYISDSFYNIDNDEVKFKKIRLLLQHLIGYKTSGNSFSNEEITPYHKIYFYDDQMDTIEMGKQINPLLNYLFENTRKGLQDVVKENIKEYEPCLIINRVNDNVYNRLETTKVILELSKFVKTFENFKFLESCQKFF